MFALNSTGQWENLTVFTNFEVAGPDGSGNYYVTANNGNIRFAQNYGSSADAQSALDAFAATQGTVQL